MNDDLFEELVDNLVLARAKIVELEQGPCRFNCRTERESFVAGYENALSAFAAVANGEVVDPSKLRSAALLAYKEWKYGQQDARKGERA